MKKECIITDITPIVSVDKEKLKNDVYIEELKILLKALEDIHDELSERKLNYATRVLSAKFRYNYHSYAWYSQDTIGNTYWLSSPVPYVQDGSYSYVSETASRVGDIIFYDGMPYQDDDGFWLEGDHSGIVTKKGYQYTDTTEVISKWGGYGLYRHTVNHCPYATVDPVSYWRKN